MSKNTLAELARNIKQLDFLYDAYVRTGSSSYAKRACKLLKVMRRQFKSLSTDIGLTQRDFETMLRKRPPTGRITRHPPAGGRIPPNRPPPHRESDDHADSA